MNNLKKTEYFMSVVQAYGGVNKCLPNVIVLRDEFLKSQKDSIAEIVEENITFVDMSGNGIFAVLTLSYFEKNK